MPSTDEFIRGKVKGRVALFLDSAYQPKFYSFDLGFVGAASVGDCLEANEDCFHFWERYLLLPDGDALVRVYYSFKQNQWLLIIESDHLPPHKYVDVDIALASYSAAREGEQVRITALQPFTNRSFYSIAE